jgi:hypothetical protein
MYEIELLIIDSIFENILSLIINSLSKNDIINK